MPGIKKTTSGLKNGTSKKNSAKGQLFLIVHFMSLGGGSATGVVTYTKLETKVVKLDR